MAPFAVKFAAAVRVRHQAVHEADRYLARFLVRLDAAGDRVGEGRHVGPAPLHRHAFTGGKLPHAHEAAAVPCVTVVCRRVGCSYLLHHGIS